VGHFGTPPSRQLPVMRNTAELAAARDSPYQDICQCYETFVTPGFSVKHFFAAEEARSPTVSENRS
jgi:hypothetical protein